MNAAPPVSVVLTTFNRADLLGATLDTILMQTYGDFELIVCDDASPDHTEAVVREYAARDRRIVYHRNRRNLRMPENLNEGIRRSRGQYIANVHDGDLYEPNLLEKWSEALNEYPRAAFVFNQYRALNDDGTTHIIFREDLPPVISGRKLLEEIFFLRWQFDSPVWGTVMGRRSAYTDAGLFDSRFTFLSDVDMWMRLAETHDIAYVAEPLISVAGRGAVPRQWTVPRDHLVLRTMFWEARMRHFRNRPLRKFVESARHAGFVAAFQVYRSLCAVNGGLKFLKRRRWLPN